MASPAKRLTAAKEAAVRKWAFISECASGLRASDGDAAAEANPSRVETDRAEGGADGRTTELKYCATLIGFLGEHRTVRRGAGREAGSGLLADRQKCVAVASVTHRVAV